MGRRALWTAIRDTLGEEIASGHYRPGDRLPTEAQLAARFGVNRHTVRRALSALAEAAPCTPARRGRLRRPPAHRLSHRAAGALYPQPDRVGPCADKRVLHLATRGADPREAEALRLAPARAVQVYEGLSCPIAQPLALFRSVFPADRFPGMLDALRETPSVTAAFRAHGLRITPAPRPA